MAFQTRSYKTYISHSAAPFFASSSGLGEECVSPSLFVENFREYCQVTRRVETSSMFLRDSKFFPFLPSSGHVPHVLQKEP